MENKNLPESYKGYSTEDLLKTLAEIRSKEGTSAPREKILALSQMMREYDLGVFSKMDKES